MIDTHEYKAIKAACLAESKRSARIASQLLGLSYHDFIESCIKTCIYNAKIVGRTTAFTQEQFWENEEEEYNNSKYSTYEMFVHSFKSDFINYGYVYDRSSQLGIDVSAYDRKEDFIADVFVKLPQIFYFQHEFDAHLSANSQIHQLPTIIVYKALFGVLQMLCHRLTTGLLVIEDNQAYLKNIDEINLINRDDRYVFTLKNVIDGILCRNSFAACEAFPTTSFAIPNRKIYGYASQFVLLHEYAHFFQGHLESTKERWQLEFEADNFALYCMLGYSQMHEDPAHLCIMGLAIVFVSSHPIEIVQSDFNSDYMSGRAKFILLTDSLPDELKVVAISWWNSIATLLNPTLNQHYSVNIDTF